MHNELRAAVSPVAANMMQMVCLQIMHKAFFYNFLKCNIFQSGSYLLFRHHTTLKTSLSYSQKSYIKHRLSNILNNVHLCFIWTVTSMVEVVVSVVVNDMVMHSFSRSVLFNIILNLQEAASSLRNAATRWSRLCDIDSNWYQRSTPGLFFCDT